MNRKTVVPIITTLLLTIPLVIIGCGAFDDNSQPTIEPITDQTLDVEDTITVPVNITDADADDTHIINASSDNVLVAAVVDGVSHKTSVTLIGVGPGIATITVSTTDNSGQDNTEAIPVTFKVTVNEPPPSVQIGFGINQPSVSFINKGMCAVGMTLKPGEGCSYDSNEFFAEINFFVRDDGQACREQVPEAIEGIEIPEHLRPRNLKFCVEWNIERDNFFDTNFAASKNRDGSWTIKSVP